MKPLRMMPWFARLLVGLFLAAQFAGVVSPPCANALPAAAAIQPDALHHMDASQDHHHHAQGHGDHGMPSGHHDHGGNPADACCALHACFAGVLPPAAAVGAETHAGEPLAAAANDVMPGASGGRLDRPPRLLH